jgi:phosphoenolpyruvate-protein phosphotransferase (PTS system enzyme I)
MTERETRVLHGISAAPGIASGPAFVLERQRLRVVKRQLEGSQLDNEVERLREALADSFAQVQELRDMLAGQHEDPQEILEAQVEMLRDPQMMDDPARLIRDESINAEWAVAKVLGKLRALYDNAEDAYLRERGEDIDHVGRRVLRNLAGQDPLLGRIPPGSVVVAHHISPAEMVQLHRARVAGVATDVGGRTSHTALMARAFELPTVLGLTDALARAEPGEMVVVDGLAGDLVLSPSDGQLVRFQERAFRLAEVEQELLKDRDKPAVSIDGYVVQLMANMELAEEVTFALDHGAEGVGLYRTEFMYMERTALPSEEDHMVDAVKVFNGMGDRPVTFRTFDLGGGEKTSELLRIPNEENPALGLRSIRLAFREEAIFRSQLRGLLRASTAGRMRLMFPMISGVAELRQAKRILEECREELARKGYTVAEQIEVGIMVEMPAAAMIADLLAKEVDFFSIGSNDLIQYTLAIDRSSELVNYLYHPLHPAILRLVRSVVNVAHEASIPVSLCGAMAGDPMYTLVLVGLGLDELSMPAAAIPRIKRIIRACNASEAVSFAESLVTMDTVELAEAAVREMMVPRFMQNLDEDRSWEVDMRPNSGAYPAVPGPRQRVRDGSGPTPGQGGSR